MRYLPHILLFAIMTLLGPSCQKSFMLSEQEAQPFECLQEEAPSICSYNESNRNLSHEGILSSVCSVCRTAFHPEERTETQAGERTTPSVRGGGKAFTACRAPRSTIHQAFSGFVQRTTIPIYLFVSHTPLFYVLRHIIR